MELTFIETVKVRDTSRLAGKAALKARLTDAGEAVIIDVYNSFLDGSTPSEDKDIFVHALHDAFITCFGKSPIQDIGDLFTVLSKRIMPDEQAGYVFEVNKEQVISDQRSLSSFMKQLKEGKSFGDLDEGTRRWWMNRY